jgi:hypothetical protein
LKPTNRAAVQARDDKIQCCGRSPGKLVRRLQDFLVRPRRRVDRPSSFAPGCSRNRMRRCRRRKYDPWRVQPEPNQSIRAPTPLRESAFSEATSKPFSVGQKASTSPHSTSNGELIGCRAELFLPQSLRIAACSSLLPHAMSLLPLSDCPRTIFAARLGLAKLAFPKSASGIGRFGTS